MTIFPLSMSRNYCLQLEKKDSHANLSTTAMWGSFSLESSLSLPSYSAIFTATITPSISTEGEEIRTIANYIAESKVAVKDEVKEHFNAMVQRARVNGKTEKAKALEANKENCCDAIFDVLMSREGKMLDAGDGEFYVLFPRAFGVDEVKTVKWIQNDQTYIAEGSFGQVNKLGKKMVVKEPKNGIAERELLNELKNIEYLMALSEGQMPEGLIPAYAFTAPNEKKGLLIEQKTGSLDKYIGIPTREILTKGFMNIFKGIQFLHSDRLANGQSKEPMPHGDIKLANMLFDEDCLYLSDFGTTKNYTERLEEGLAPYTGTMAIVPIAEGIALTNLHTQETMGEAIKAGIRLEIFQCGLAMYAFCIGKIPLFDNQQANPYSGSGFGLNIEKGFTEKGEHGFKMIQEEYGGDIEALIRILLSPNPKDRLTAEECQEFLANL